MSVGGPICPKRHPRLYGTDFACGGLEQANGAASPAISSLFLPAPLGSAATIALNWGVRDGGSSTKEGCRLAGQAERDGTESARLYGLSSRFRALERLLCGFWIAGSRENGDWGRLASQTGWGDDGAWLPAELAAVRVPCAFWVVYG